MPGSTSFDEGGSPLAICVHGERRAGLIALGSLDFDQLASVGRIAARIAVIIEASVREQLGLARR